MCVRAYVHVCVLVDIMHACIYMCICEQGAAEEMCMFCLPSFVGGLFVWALLACLALNLNMVSALYISPCEDVFV